MSLHERLHPSDDIPLIPDKEYADREVLLSEEQIKERLQTLSQQIAQEYQGQSVLIVGVLKGGVTITADLMRELHKAGCSAELDFIQTESYKGMQKGEFKITKDLTTDVTEKKILLVDDIFDSGDTMAALHASLAKRSPSVRSFVLLDKRLERKTQYRPDYVGFSIPNKWVEGYGMDSGQGGRGNPHIIVRKKNE